MRTNQARYWVTFTPEGMDAVRCLGMRGGNMDSEESKIRPAGMEPEEAQGGATTVSNPVFRIKYDPALHDLHAYRALIERDASGTGRRQKLDQHRNPAGDADIYTGVMKALNVVEFDANGNDPDIFEIELSADGTIA